MNLTKWLCSTSWNVRNIEIIREAYRRWHTETVGKAMTWPAWKEYVQAEHNGEME